MGAHIRRGLVCCSETITDGSMDVEQPAAAAKKAPEPEEDEDMGFSPSTKDLDAINLGKDSGVVCAE